jgi:hypothetical protein
LFQKDGEEVMVVEELDMVTIDHMDDGLIHMHILIMEVALVVSVLVFTEVIAVGVN